MRINKGNWELGIIVAVPLIGVLIFPFFSPLVLCSCVRPRGVFFCWIGSSCLGRFLLVGLCSSLFLFLCDSSSINLVFTFFFYLFAALFHGEKIFTETR